MMTATLHKIALPVGALDHYPWSQDIAALLEPTADLLRQMWALGYREVGKGAISDAFDLPNGPAASWARQRAGQLVTEIDATTHTQVETLLHALLGDGLDDASVSMADLRAAILAEFDGMAETRAEMIARTETSMAANAGTLGGYRDTGFGYVQVRDGVENDEECRSADGSIWSADYAGVNLLGHPNCGRSFDPISTAEALAAGVDEL